MANTISKLFPTGNLQLGVELDEITHNSIKFSDSGIYASTFDEVTNNGSGIAERRTSTGELLISGEFDEQTANIALNYTGQFLVTSSGVTSWIVPAGVISISAVTIGGGGGAGNRAGGGGGGLGWKNNIAVTPGETLTITVGSGGSGGAFNGSAGGATSISRGATVLLSANGGTGANTGTPGVGGSPGVTAEGGGRGGHGGGSFVLYAGGGGGAGGWWGIGGFGSVSSSDGQTVGDDGSGGGGGGGGYNFPGGPGYGGGGTNPQGLGNGGRFGDVAASNQNGKGGSAFGSTAFDATGKDGGYPGGGAGGNGGNGANGAVNIIWGINASFPRGLPPEPTTTYQIYDTHGTYYWRAPAGVTSVNVACVGGGGGGDTGKDAGGGGGLGWKNNIAVTPGQDYLVVVGSAGHTYIVASGFFTTRNGGDSYFINSTTVKGGGGSNSGNGGNWVGDGGYNGGNGGNGSIYANGNPGGGSAATFSGAGANGSNQTGNQYYPAGSPVSLRGISTLENTAAMSAGRFGAGSKGAMSSSDDYTGAGGSGGVWIDWTPGGSFPTLGI